jgi:radical SAM protein with 4Fe4S-binding SPASM domain
MEITARCNNNCRHCYINLPEHDKEAQRKELSLEQIKKIIDDASELGAVWCLLTGGEPLLREDFFEIYLYLKKKGLFVSVFTNATLVNEEHIKLFKKFPPRDIEVSVYGVTEKTYESLTRKTGSYAAFMRGLDLLLKNNIKVRLKAMAIKSTFDELPQISQFCRERTKDYFRFDPLLHLRFDGDSRKNEEIKNERLPPDEIVRVEQADAQRMGALVDNCDKFIMPEFAHSQCRHIFRCGAGMSGVAVSYDGLLRICSSHWHKDCLYDLKNGNLSYGWNNFIPRVRDITSHNKDYLEKCCVCPIINLCLLCPAHAYLEMRVMDEPVEYFCQVAHAREKMITQAAKK